jgi:hypothetical protein
MHQVDTLLISADPVQRLHLTQERIDLHAEQLRLATAASTDFDQLEKSFTRVARAWGDRHDITFSAWRQVGVDTEVLARAGITPAPKPARPQAAPGAPKLVAPTAPPSEPDVTPAEPEAAPDASAAVAGPESKPAAPAKKSSAGKKTAPAKKAAASKEAAAAANGSPARPAKKAAAKVAPAAEGPKQQQLPAEAHLLS